MKGNIFLLSFLISLIILSVPVLGTTIQVKLVLNNTSAKVYIPEVGEKSASSLTSLTTYANRSHYYLSSYINNMLTGLVFSHQKPLSIFTDGGGGTYMLGNDLEFPNSMVFLLFSKGNWRAVNNRMGMIEKGNFLSYPEPSFSFGLGRKHRIKMLLKYEDMNMLGGDRSVGRGKNTFSIKHEGLMGDHIGLNITRK